MQQCILAVHAIESLKACGRKKKILSSPYKMVLLNNYDAGSYTRQPEHAWTILINFVVRK